MRRDNALPLFFLTAAVALLFAPVLCGRVLYYGDLMLQFYPWRKFASECLRQNLMPLWNPYQLCGMPFIGNGQSAIFYPYHVLTFWLPPERVISLGALLHTMAAGWFMFAFLRTLHLRRLSATLGALAFMLSGFVIGRVQFPSLHYSLSWIPLQLLLAHRLACGASRLPSVIALAGVTSIQLLCGHAQAALLGWLYTLGWVLFCTPKAPLSTIPESRLKRRSYIDLIDPHSSAMGSLPLSRAAALRLRTAALCLLAFGAGVALAALQLMPLFELVRLSSRTVIGWEEATLLSLLPSHTLGLFVPHLFGHPALGFYWGSGNVWEMSAYMGVVISALSLVGASWQGCRLRTFLFVTALTGILLALGRFAPFYQLLFALPGADIFRGPVRFLLWFALSMSVLAAFGMERLIQETSPAPARRVVWLTAAAGITFFFVANGLFMLPTLQRAFAFFFHHVARAHLDIKKGFESAALSSALWQTTLSLLVGSLFLLALCLVVRLGLRHRLPIQRRWANAIFGLAALELLLAGWGMNPTLPRSPYRKEKSLPKALVDICFDMAQHKGNYRLVTPHRSVKEAWKAGVNYNSYRHPAGALQAADLFLQTLAPNISMWFHLPNAHGYDAIRVLPIWRALQRAEENWWRGRDPSAFRWFSVRYVLLTRTSFHPRQGVLPRVTVMKNLSALPRCFLQVEGKRWKAVHARFGVNEVTAHLPADATASIWLSTRGESAGAVPLPYSVLLTDTFYPGWRAFADRKHESIRAYKGIFREVQLTQPARMVTFIYLPNDFRLGAFITLMSLLLLTACLIAFWVIKR